MTSMSAAVPSARGHSIRCRSSARGAVAGRGPRRGGPPRPTRGSTTPASRVAGATGGSDSRSFGVAGLGRDRVARARAGGRSPCGRSTQRGPARTDPPSTTTRSSAITVDAAGREVPERRALPAALRGEQRPRRAAAAVERPAVQRRPAGPPREERSGRREERDARSTRATRAPGSPASPCAPRDRRGSAMPGWITTVASDPSTRLVVGLEVVARLAARAPPRGQL